MPKPILPFEHDLPHHAALWQRGWLRWPLAWSVALLITLGMLAALASHQSFSPKPLIPEKLSIALHTLPHQAASAKPPVSRALPLAPSALPAEAPATQLRPPAPPPPAKPAMPDTPPAPAPRSATEGPLAAATAKTPATIASSGTLPANPIPEPISSQASFADMPLPQRCPQQTKPVFPRAAQDDDISHARVLARLLLDANGRVRSVQILEASPAGYFETAVRNAALQWRCLPSGQAGDAVRVPFLFDLRD